MKKKQLTKIQFKEAFKRGVGYSYIHLKESQHREKYRDIVLWACLQNTCYDMQSEGSRGQFLYNAIGLFEDRSFFEEAIIHKFSQKRMIDIWVFDQLCELVYLFSLDGSGTAREALYTKYQSLLEQLPYRKNDEKERLEWLCVRLTSLDGFDAFQKIVTQLGKYSFENNDPVDMDWFYSHAKNESGEQRVDAYLQNHSTTSKYIHCFLKSVSRSKTSPRNNIERPTVKELVQATRQGRSRGLAVRFGKVATADELIELAKQAIQETDLDIKLELLWPFRRARFPLDEQIIFELTEIEDSSIRDIAFEMLQHVPSDRARDYAIHLIQQNKEFANALSLLCYCYRDEDETLLFEGVQSLKVSYTHDEWHEVFMDVTSLLDHPSVEMNPVIFTYIYRQTLCSHCRHTLIAKMFQRNILPPEMLEECLYDSYESIRELAMSKQS